MTKIEQQMEDLAGELMKLGESNSNPKAEACAKSLLALLVEHRKAKRQLTACKKALRFQRDNCQLLSSAAAWIRKAGVGL